jgi:prolyl oligopeptidase
MVGGRRLVWASSLFLMVGVFLADDSASSKAASEVALPEAAIKPVAEIFHGTRVVDNYRWLEDGTSAATQKWVAGEMAYTRALLDPLPGRERIHKRLTELLAIGSVTPPQIAGKHYFYTKREETQNQPVLYVREGLNAADRVMVDPNQLSADGTEALDWFQPSDNGKYLAYGTSSGGSEMSTLHIIETKTNTLLSDTIERTRAASIAWLHDNSGFYYTRYPKKGDVPDGQEVYNRHVFFHALGTDPDGDDLVFGEGRDAEDWPNVHLSNDGRWLLIDVEQGWSKSELLLKDLKSDRPPSRVTTGKNFLYRGEVYEGKLYITTNEDAPRYRVFVTDAGDFDRENWKELIPQTDAVLQGVAVFGGKLFAQYEQNASSQLEIFDLNGEKLGNLLLPTIGTVFGAGGHWKSDEIFYGFQSFTTPPSVYRIDLKAASQGLKPESLPGPSGTAESRALPKPVLWTKVDALSIDPSAYLVNQEWFKSKDGTRVPMFIVHKKSLVKNGKNPTLLTAYGGFNVSLTPAFSRTAYLWMEHGGIYAVANLRGGAEFGEDWHRAGMLDKKQNVFDDMIAAAEHLIAEKYTDKNHLAIQGGSNGGLLMGAMMTQRPDLFRAVVCQVPLLDMLHYQDFQIAKLWIPEYGSAENADQFKWLYAYSPYHHVKPGAEYPAILFMTADTDTRVDPMHAKKMAALMQAEARNGASRTRPILLRIESKAGHGAGKPVAKQIEEFTDVYSFLFWQLGVKP